MRVIVHAGLHKSGTTSLQEAWRRAYADHPAVWYPSPPPGPPGTTGCSARCCGRSPTAGPLTCSARRSPSRAAGGRQTLADVLAEGRRNEVGTLVLSSEDLDRAHEEDRAALEQVLGEERVTLVLTATAPIHRWCSGWQTLVKHGLAQYPADAARHVVEFAALRSGRLAELVELIPASRRVVRLVRNSPPEPDLAADLAAALGLPDAGSAVAMPVHNASLGTDTEVVLRINRADLALGTDRAGRDLLERLRGDGFAYLDAPGLEERYAVPDEVLEAAAVEAAWLGDLDSLLDPHGLLATWTDPTPPEWYRTISSREAVVPELDGAEDRETQLWRARQERGAYRKGLLRLGR